MALKIRKDDTVKVIAGKDKGKTGTVLRVDAENEPRLRRGQNISEAPPAAALDARRPARRRGRRRDREGGPDPHLQRDAGRPQGRASPPASRIERARTAGACASRRSPGRRSTDGRRRGQGQPAPEDALREEIKPQLHRALRLLQRDAGAAAREDHAEHGRGRGQERHEAARRRRRAARDDRRAEAATCAARASRSPTSSSARACRSAWR